MKEWQSQALKLYATGDYTQKYIANKLDVPTSTLNDFIKKNAPPTEGAKILFFDIETAPIVMYGWSLFPKFIPHEMIIEDWSVLTWSAKWLGSDVILNDSIDINNPRDDFNVCLSLWELINQADIIVAHNGDKFDIKKMNTRWMQFGLHEPSSFKSIDTLKIAKRKFAFTSNRLDYLSKATGGEGKVKHEGFEMWKKILNKDPEALAEMMRYNDGDVVELERVYIKIRGWDHLHPNLNMYTNLDKVSCPNCGGTDLSVLGTYKTQVASYTTFRCKTDTCGKVSRSRVTELTRGQSQNIIVPSK